MASDVFVIDSNVFIAFYHGNDERHRDALRVMEELDGKTLIVHPYVIQETATVLAYKFGLATARAFLSDAASASNLLIPPVDMRSDIDGFMEIGKKVSFTDAVLVRLARQMNAHLVTFDKQMLALLKYH